MDLLEQDGIETLDELKTSIKDDLTKYREQAEKDRVNDLF